MKAELCDVSARATYSINLHMVHLDDNDAKNVWRSWMLLELLLGLLFNRNCFLVTTKSLRKQVARYSLSITEYQ